MSENWLTIREASVEFDYSPEYLRQLIRQGKVDGHKRGWHWEIERGSLERYKKEQDRKEVK